MRAAVFERAGEPAEVLRVRDVPEPEPGPGEVRVRLIASPINPSDLLFVRGKYGTQPRPPQTPGFEGVGVVESGGGLLGWWRRGKRVAVLNRSTGNWKQLACVPAKEVIPVPDALSDEQAAMFFVNPATAYVMLRDVLRPKPGEWVLQSAANGALGRMVIRLARLDGVRTVNLVRDAGQAGELKELGADAVIDTAGGSVADRVREVTGGAGAKYALDAVGGDVGTQVIESLGEGGRVLLYGLLSGEPSRVDPRALLVNGATVEGFWLSRWVQRQGVVKLAGLFRRLGRLIADGTLASPVAEVYPLDRVGEAAAHAERAGKGGKILLRMSEP